MLLTNTIQAETVNVTVVIGNVICGSLRGCSVCPDSFADEAAEKPAAKRIGNGGMSEHRMVLRDMRRAGRVPAAMYSGTPAPWHQAWLSLPTSHQPGLGRSLGNFAGCSPS